MFKIFKYLCFYLNIINNISFIYTTSRKNQPHFHQRKESRRRGSKTSPHIYPLGHDFAFASPERAQRFRQLAVTRRLLLLLLLLLLFLTARVLLLLSGRTSAVTHMRDR